MFGIRRVLWSTVLITAVSAAAPARAQEPVPSPPPTDLPAPGSTMLADQAVRVTKDERVQVKVRCIAGTVRCQGTLKLVSERPLSPGKGKAKRIITIAEGSVGDLAPDQVATLTLRLHKDARAHARKVRTTKATWEMYWPDGAKQFMFVSHAALVTSNALDH